MIRAISFAAAVIAAAMAMASEPVKLIRLPSTPGVYLVTVTADAVTIESATVITPTTPPTPPQPPQPPQPDTLTTRAKAIKTAADKATTDPNRAKTAANLGAAMDQVSKGCGQTFKTYDQIGQAAVWMFDKVVDAQPNAWKPTRKLIVDEMAKMAQDGATDAQFGAYLGEVASGCNASVPANAPKEINIDFIMKLLDFFIKYILPLIVKGVPLDIMG